MDKQLIKKITIEVPVEFYKLLKMNCIQQDVTIKRFIIESVEEKILKPVER